MGGNIGHRNGKSQKDEVHVILNVDLQCNNKINTKLRAKVDTGAQRHILPMRLYRQMYTNSVGAGGNPRLGELKKTNTILTAYGGSRLKQHGTLRIPCEYHHRGKEEKSQPDRRNQEEEDQSSKLIPLTS